MTVSQINSGTAGEKADAKFGAIITLYRRKFLPSERRLLDLKKKLHKVFPAGGALVDAFTVAREAELDEIDLMLIAPATPENINLLAQRLMVPNTPDLEFSTREHHAYLLDDYIEPRFANVPIREMKVLMIDEWLLPLRDAKGRPLAGTTKASIRTLLSKCFKLAAKHELISVFEHNPMQLIEVKGVSKRQKEIQQITVDQFKAIRTDRTGRSPGWYWYQVIVAIAIDWGRNAWHQRTTLLFAAIWSIFSPAWILFTTHLNVGTLVGYTSRIPWPWSFLCDYAFFAVVSSLFIWLGVAIYSSVHLIAIGKLPLRRVWKGFLCGLLAYALARACLIAITIYSQHPAGHVVDWRTLTRLGAIEDFGTWNSLLRDPYFIGTVTADNNAVGFRTSGACLHRRQAARNTHAMMAEMRKVIQAARNTPVLVASSSQQGEGEVRVWDTDSCENLSGFHTVYDGCARFTISASGDRVIAADWRKGQRGGVACYDTLLGKVIWHR